VTDLLTQNNTQRVNFQPKKYVGPPPPHHVYFEYLPWEWVFSPIQAESVFGFLLAITFE